MSETHRQVVWLRRGLAAFVGLLALVVTCGLIWALLAALGDSIGMRAFRIMTLIAAVADGFCGIALLIGSVWCLIRMNEPRDGEIK